MSKTQDIIDDYVARLKTAHPTLSVIQTPDNPSNYALKHPVGEILVQYTSSDFAEPDNTGGNYQGAPLVDRPQRRRLNIQLTLVLRSLGGANGTTQVLDNVRDSLKKFRPRHCLTQVYFLGEGFISEKQGIWQYGLRTAVELWEQ
ncbi:Gp37 family protein [Acinetobacter ursingii]|uniref:Gp37 family protein n=1 Tax=Acinetobacter ursingii TaxID=108980 RepID=UPI00244BA473|nr:Gp37 family protein [Acinetobacter ursingii]MDG9992351.1 Gp37 family protein [Acinetobacter ursingii]MDH0204342.1 Gp37 family protein [Acinetobacter ursingii]